MKTIQNIKPFINQYSCKDIDIPSHQKDLKKLEQEDLKKLLKKNNKKIGWKKFEQNNKKIALNILFVPHNTKTIRLVYKSKYTASMRIK